MRRAFIPSPLVAFSFLAAFAFYQFQIYPLLDESDVPWHLAAGDLIRSLGALPKTDPWSFTAAGAPWYNISWAWDVALSFFVDAFGLAALQCGVALAGGLLIALLADTLRKRGVSTEAIIFTLFAAVPALTEVICARPQLGVFFLILMAERILWRWRQEQRNKTLLWLLPIAVLWANIHGSILILFIIIGAYVAEAILTRNMRVLKVLIAAALACVIAACVNPYGPWLAVGILRTLDSVARGFLIEWLPLQFGRDMGLSLWLVMFIIVSNLRDIHVPIASRILAFLFLAATLLSARNGAFFVLLSAPYVAYHAGRLREQFLSANAHTLPTIPASLHTWMPIGVGAVAAGIFAFGMSGKNGEARISSGMLSSADSMEYIQSHYSDAHFLNDYILGGMMAYESKGSFPLFIDGRAGTAYPETVLSDYIEYLALKPGWEHILEKYRIRGIIVHKNSGFNTLYAHGGLDNRFTRVFEGKSTHVYLFNAAQGG